MEDITKIVKYLQYSTFLITIVIQTTNNGVTKGWISWYVIKDIRKKV